MIISDHSPVILQIADSIPKGSDYLLFPSYLAKEDDFRKLLRGWWLEFADNNSVHEIPLDYTGRPPRRS